MQAIIDEGVPRHLADALRARGAQVSNFPDAWKGIRNGILLGRIEADGFELLLTNDKSIGRQQNLAAVNLSIVVLPTNLRPVLVPRAADIAATLLLAGQRDYVVIAADGRRWVEHRDGTKRALPAIAPFRLQVSQN